MNDLLKVLLIEDNPGDSRLIQELLAESKAVVFELHCADRLTHGLEQLAGHEFDLVLLDLALPDSLGLETLLAVRHYRPELAVIVLTGTDDEALGLHATQAGAQDYLVKGRVSSWLLIRSIRYAIERKRFESRLEYLATHDDLTGLPNRLMFNFILGLALERARRGQHNDNENNKVAVMLLDLDNFKQVNDTYGHILGDKLLRAVAERLQGCMRKSDTVARTGGDEFTLVIENMVDARDSAVTAKKVLTALAAPFDLAGYRLQTSASIGISVFPADGVNAEGLLQYADIAMYHAKQVRNCYEFYDSSRETILARPS
ncbi:MAG: GGDEF domain-containing response regulator [Chloroflexi bacterium]|nr:GGDEF domain-containing response regulator [Chloroflexota bacterium]